MNIRISGYVQGVGFRYAAMRTARKTDIKGYVRNLPDGNVCIEAEGLEKNMKEFVLWCREGPPHARVENVETVEDAWKEFADFDIVL